jgi:hypothetical protein
MRPAATVAFTRRIGGWSNWRVEDDYRRRVGLPTMVPNRFDSSLRWLEINA